MSITVSSNTKTQVSISLGAYRRMSVFVHTVVQTRPGEKKGNVGEARIELI
jgi:hypothetical protein